MKAKVIATGEIINVSREYDASFNEWRYTDVVSDKEYCSRQLDFDDLVDWEQRRYEIAKDMLAALESNPNPQIFVGNPDEQVKCALMFADELIKQLKSR